MNPEQAIALACDALDTDPSLATILHADDAITVRTGDSLVARVIPGDAIMLAAARRVLRGASLLPDHLLQPSGEIIETDEALIVPYPIFATDAGGMADLGIAGACLASMHGAGRQLLDAGTIDLPRFDPQTIATGWLDRSFAVFTGEQQTHLLDSIAEHWPSVTGRETVIHADAHALNWAPVRPDWWMLLDSEFLSIGPAVYDLAPLEVTERRLHWTSPRFPSFLAGYEEHGDRIDRDALTAAVRVRELLAVAWLGARVGGDAAIAEQARQRLRDALAAREQS